jgi:K+-transporting ATPase ATPase C chain
MLVKLLRILALSVLLYALLGIVYPLIVTLLGQILFKDKALGSLVFDEKQNLVGSKFIGQIFRSDRYFQGREVLDLRLFKSTLDQNFELFWIKTKFLRSQTQLYSQRLLEQNDAHLLIPIELVTHSASGVDPHITYEGAFYQVERIAKSRNLEKKLLYDLIEEHKETSWLSSDVIINVLNLNLALDHKSEMTSSSLD